MADLPIAGLDQRKGAMSRRMVWGDRYRLRTLVLGRSDGTVHQAGKGCREARDGADSGGDPAKKLDHGLRSPTGARSASELRLHRAQRSAIMGASDPCVGSGFYQAYSGNSFSQEGVL